MKRRGDWEKGRGGEKEKEKEGKGDGKNFVNSEILNKFDILVAKIIPNENHAVS